MIDLRQLEQWFKERPIWLQDAARRLLQNGEISPDDIDQLVIFCKKEAGIDVIGDDLPRAFGIPKGALMHEAEPMDLQLIAIMDVQGINALSPRKPLEFGDGNLTIIYGSNGSGKSGYVRILKHACGARHIEKILHNAYKGEPPLQGCKFLYKLNGEDKDHSWLITDGILSDLSTIEIYDSHCGEVYVNEENEVTYEPKLLGFLQELVKVSDTVSNKIDAEIREKISKKSTIPQDYIYTEAWKWYSNLSFNTTEDEINKWSNWTDDNNKEHTELNTRLSEPNPADKAALLRKQKRYISSLAIDLQIFVDLLSPNNCSAYITAQKDAQAKRQVASVDAQKIFEDSPLTGIGSESWRLLWEQARAFSEGEAYKEIPFPNISEGSHCVLCQQPLEEPAKIRLRSFEEFIKGSLEKAAAQAELKLSELQNQINNIPTEDDVILRLDSGGVTEEPLRHSVLSLRTSLEHRKIALLSIDEIENFKEPIDHEVINTMNILADSHEKQAVVLDNDAKKNNRQELQDILKELKARKWISGQAESIKAELIRLKDINKLEDAKRHTNTRALTEKKSELVDELITVAYKKRFYEEIEKLGASYMKVSLEKTGIAKGRVFHQIKLKDVTSDVYSSEVLSDGEFRIVSLAAFLADIEGHPVKAPLIFDDPISSLDQDFEEAAVKLFVKLCETRQVIVFTHRLSLLALLQTAADKESIKYHVISLEREAWGCGEPCEPPLPAQKPQNAINSLIDRVTKARKVLDENGKAEYQIYAQSICSDLRKTLERVIELELLSEVVQRFRRDVQTKNKLHKLAAISNGDCTFLDNLMTEYSKYQHSQSYETPVLHPGPDQLQGDLIRLKEWVEDFKKRT